MIHEKTGYGIGGSGTRRRLSTHLFAGVATSHSRFHERAQASASNARSGPEPTISLQTLLERVAASSDKEFLVDSRVEQLLYIGGTPIENPTYPILLSILRNNQLVAVQIEDRVNIVPEAFARQLPVRLVQRDDADIPDDEWVSRVITVTKGDAAHLVPILRPLLPQAAHMASLGPESGKLLIVDRYANVRRITEIVEALDR